MTIVFSTNKEKMKEQEEKFKIDKENEILGDGRVKVQREKRNGKTISVIFGLPLNANDLKSLCKELKKTCGSGGTVKEANIEIQGDYIEKIIEILTTKGFKAKKVGA